jgi:hypothetical protein
VVVHLEKRPAVSPPDPSKLRAEPVERAGIASAGLTEGDPPRDRASDDRAVRVDKGTQSLRPEDVPPLTELGRMRLGRHAVLRDQSNRRSGRGGGNEATHDSVEALVRVRDGRTKTTRRMRNIGRERRCVVVAPVTMRDEVDDEGDESAKGRPGFLAQAEEDVGRKL